jgi:8-oxo-dGTP pyrophosphatase MutT (NUDIX family)
VTAAGIRYPTVSVVLLRRPADAEWAVCLTRRPDATRWTLPGGHVKAQEHPGQTALHEAFAHTGRAVVLVAPPHQLPLPDGFGTGRETAVPTPWWIMKYPVPAGWCSDAPGHIHLDHLYVGVQDTAHPVDPRKRNPLRWANATELAGPGLTDGIRRLTSDILRLATGRTPTNTPAHPPNPTPPPDRRPPTEHDHRRRTTLDIHAGARVASGGAPVPLAPGSSPRSRASPDQR